MAYESYALYLRHGGRVSEKQVTGNSGVLRKLLPGDIVLADRGFNVADSVGFYQAKPYIRTSLTVKSNCLHRKWKKQEKLQM